jgi:cation/acetate symporter
MENLAIYIFLFLVTITLVITYVSARRMKTATDYYAAGRSITGWQNGLAIAGEFMASAAFLGIGGLIAFWGIDGQIFSLCWFASYLVVLLLVAEAIRNSGKFTFADVISYRLDSRIMRPLAAVATLVVSITYLVPQMVAAGALAKLLFGISTTWGIIIVGVLMVTYIAFGGMVAATWIQIVKAVLLLGGSYILAIAVMSHFNFSINELFGAVLNTTGLEHHLEPGGWLKNPWERYSLGFSLLFGTAALPHVLMRFYTVPSKNHAQSSALWTMTFMGMFHILTFIFGLGAAVLVGNSVIKSLDPGGNIAVPLLAQIAGGGAGTLGGEFLMSFIITVAFITIIAAVSGLCIAASSAFSYDFWFNVVKKGKQTQKEQVKTARISAMIIGGLAILVSLSVQGHNVAYLSGLAFAMAATANLPTIIFSLYWKKLTTTGAVIGMSGGVIVAVILVLTGPQFMGKNALFPLSNPGIVSIPLGFLLTYLGSIFTQDPEAAHKYVELSVRSQSGLGAE